jgi:hypothetical protein
LPSGLRQFSIAEAGPRPQPADVPALPPTEARARQSDALAVALRAGLDRLASPLTRAAAAFVEGECWKELGFARLEDHARERLGRSGRWLRDLAVLGRSFAALPGLEGAVRGTDGRAAIGRVAGLIVARVATADSLARWVERARALSVRELRGEVAAIVGAGPTDAGTGMAPESGENVPAHGRPVAAAGPDPGADSDDDDAGRRLVRLQLPAPVRAAFDEALDLFRAVEGRESSVTEFASALVADALASGVELPEPIDGVFSDILNRGRPVEIRERALAHSTNRWEHLPAAGEEAWALRLARSSLERLAELEAVAGMGGPVALDDQLRELIRLEDEIETRIGGLLEQMAEDGAWTRLRFDSVAHYAEQRLAMGRTAARMRLRVRRALRRFPTIKAAYEEGEVGAEAAWLVARMIRSGGQAAVDMEALIERAKVATVKRLRDEMRLIEREAARSSWISVAGDESCGDGTPGEGHAGSAVGAPVPGPMDGDRGGAGAARLPGGSPGSVVLDPAGTTINRGSGGDFLALPVSDARWFTGLRREAGTSRLRIAVLSRAVAQYRVSDVFLQLRLPDPLAIDLLAAVEARRRLIEATVSEVPWDEPWPEEEATGSARAAREFFVRCRRTPAWVGLLSLLEEFVNTWDVDHAAARGASRRPDQEVAIRDGWRCVAPGCTSRRNLDNHHVHYSSRGGSDESWNRATVCRFHHLRGEHGELARCRGRAPLGLTWTLGKNGCGGRYRNELAIAPLLRAGEAGAGLAEM